MKRSRKLLAALCCVLLLAVLSLQAFADEYTYTVTVYAGRQGEFTVGDDPKVYTVTGLKYGEIFRFNYREWVKVPENSKYTVRGIRESGQDNNTVSASAFYVTRDQEYVVAYQLPSNRVEYTVYFRESGTTRDLMPPEVYYGNDGDEVVVAFPYIDGYRPAALNGRWTLREGANNDRVFYYTAITVPTPVPPQPTQRPAPVTTARPTPSQEPTQEPEETEEPIVPGPVEPPPEPTPAPTPAPTPEPEPEPTPEPTIPPELILDMETPLIGRIFTRVDENGNVVINPWAVAAAVVVCLLLGAGLFLLILLLVRRKKKKEEEKKEEASVSSGHKS